MGHRRAPSPRFTGRGRGEGAWILRDDLPLPHPVPLHPRGRGWRGNAMGALTEVETGFREGCLCGLRWLMGVDVDRDAADAIMRPGTRWANDALPRPASDAGRGYPKRAAAQRAARLQPRAERSDALGRRCLDRGVIYVGRPRRGMLDDVVRRRRITEADGDQLTQILSKLTVNQ